MPPVVRSVRTDVVVVRPRFAATMKIAGLLSVILALAAAPEVAEAQGFIARANSSQTVWVEYGRGGPDSNGFESARAPVEYLVYACRGLTPGAVMVRYRLRAENATASNAYWYEGTRYETTSRPNVRAARLDATATSPSGEVGSLRREATPASSMPADCESGGINFVDLGLLSRFADPTQPAAVTQFLNTVTLSAQAMSEPLRDNTLEQEFARQRRAAEQEAAERERAERERQAAEARAAAQAQAGSQTGSSSGSQSGTQSADSATATTMTPAQIEAAEQARRQEAARRAAEQAAEDARRQQEQQEEMAAAATDVAVMAARSGGAFGAYYFTGGDASSSYNKFSEVTGIGFGFNFGPMILDIGQLTGTYNEFFIEDYADENSGSLPETGEVGGYFVHVGLQLQKTFDSLRMGMSGGYMHAITDDTEITSPTLGFIIGYSMLKFRVDAGLGDEGTVGYAMYLQF